MNTVTPLHLDKGGWEGYGSTGILLAMITPTDLGFFWEEREKDRWVVVGWYVTSRGAKAAASRRWGERLKWER